MTVSGLREVVIYVRDLTAQASFYRDVLGLSMTTPAYLAEVEEARFAWFDLGPIRLALHSGGEGKPGDDGPALVFGVDNLHAAAEELSEKGLEIKDIERPEGSAPYFSFFDPEGFLLQLEQA